MPEFFEKRNNTDPVIIEDLPLRDIASRFNRMDIFAPKNIDT